MKTTLYTLEAFTNRSWGTVTGITARTKPELFKKIGRLSANDFVYFCKGRFRVVKTVRTVTKEKSISFTQLHTKILKEALNAKSGSAH